MTIEPKTEQLQAMSLREIAGLVYRTWPKPNFAAAPYLQAMAQMDSINDSFWNDDGRSVVAYFLNNAKTWRGDVAKLVKAELNRRLKS